jgi:hypothetical protein
MLKLHTPSGALHPVMPGQITDVRPPIDKEYGPEIRAVLVLQGTKIGVRETVAEVEALIEALPD